MLLLIFFLLLFSCLLILPLPKIVMGGSVEELLLPLGPAPCESQQSPPPASPLPTRLRQAHIKSLFQRTRWLSGTSIQSSSTRAAGKPEIVSVGFHQSIKQSPKYHVEDRKGYSSCFTSVVCCCGFDPRGLLTAPGQEQQPLF